MNTEDKIGTLTITYINGSKNNLPHTTKQDLERMIGEMDQNTRTFTFDYKDVKLVVMLNNVLSLELNYDKENE